PERLPKGRTKRKGPATPAFRYRCSLPGLAGFTARCRQTHEGRLSPDEGFVPQRPALVERHLHARNGPLSSPAPSVRLAHPGPAHRRPPRRSVAARPGVRRLGGVRGGHPALRVARAAHLGRAPRRTVHLLDLALGGSPPPPQGPPLGRRAQRPRALVALA